MTRDDIANELMALVLEIGNGVGGAEDYSRVELAQRAYIRGLASSVILELRDSVLGVARGTSARERGDET